jgi:phage shock protein A
VNYDIPAPGGNSANLDGLSVSAAKEFIFSHVTQAKLNEKRLAELRAEKEKWDKRAELARNQESFDLASQAEKVSADTAAKIAALEAETADLKAQIESMLRQVPALAARERSVDPDLLLQELLIAAGMNPGDEDKLGEDKKFAELEKNAQADDALAALKAKMGKG